jgi:hypothetical protein
MSPPAGRAECDGRVATLRGEVVLFTGKSRVHGEHVLRRQLFCAVRLRGGTPLSGTRNAGVSILVLGELLPEVVTDPVNVRSQNLVYVDGQRRAGNHICIVDDLGISALLEGRPASCLRTRPLHAELIEVSLRGTG